MDPNVEIATPHGTMNEMYEYFAFDEALENGLSVDALIEEQAAQGRGHIESRVNQVVSQLNELIEANEREREALVREARGLTPQAAQAYCEQLSQRLTEMKLTESKQKKEFDSAEKAANAQKEQNTILIASITKMRALIQRQKENQSHFQNQLYAAGTGLCQYIANPNQNNRKGHDSRKY